MATITQTEFNEMLRIAIASAQVGGYYTSKWSGEEIDALLGGRSLVISGVYPSLAALKAAFPNGAEGAYQISSTKDLYVWNQKTKAWENLGPIQGPKGDNGATFTPTVSAAGVLSWANNGGLSNPPSVNLKGADGIGIQSIARTVGNGAAGTTDTYTITLSNGSKYTFKVYNGANGVSIQSIVRTSGNGAPGTTDTYTITLSNGSKPTFKVYNGKNGIGIKSITRTAGNGEAGTTDTYTVMLDNNATYTFRVYNGSNGVGITKIAKTNGNGAPGTTDTYTIYLSDGRTYPFTVYNGAGAAADVPAVLRAAKEAKEAAESAKQYSGKPPIIQDNQDGMATWWTWNAAKQQYEDTGQLARGNLMYSTFILDPRTGDLYMYTDKEYAGPQFRLNGPDLEVVLTYGDS